MSFYDQNTRIPADELFKYFKDLRELQIEWLTVFNNNLMPQIFNDYTTFDKEIEQQIEVLQFYSRNNMGVTFTDLLNAIVSRIRHARQITLQIPSTGFN